MEDIIGVKCVMVVQKEGLDEEGFVKDENRELGLRIDKAIEYIKNDLIPFGDEWHWDEGGIGNMVEDVLNILEGDKD